MVTKHFKFQVYCNNKGMGGVPRFFSLPPRRQTFPDGAGQ